MSNPNETKTMIMREMDMALLRCDEFQKIVLDPTSTKKEKLQAGRVIIDLQTKVERFTKWPNKTWKGRGKNKKRKQEAPQPQHSGLEDLISHIEQ